MSSGPRRSARVASKRDAQEVPPAKEPLSKKAKAAVPVASTVKAKTLAVGDSIPDVTLKDHEGNDVNLLAVAKKQTVVLFAYPKASTPGCTRQACGFRDLYPKFEEVDAAVFGISADSPNAQKNFKTKQKLPYTLISDSKFELLGPLGAKKTAAGGVIRSHWLFRNGKLVEANLGVKPDASPKTSLEYAAKAIGSGQKKEEKEDGGAEESNDKADSTDAGKSAEQNGNGHAETKEV